MANAVYILLILGLSGISIYFISYGIVKDKLFLGLGIPGALFSTYLIYRFNYPDIRVVVHLLLIVVLSYFSVKVMKKRLTKKSK